MSNNKKSNNKEKDNGSDTWMKEKTNDIGNKAAKAKVVFNEDDAFEEFEVDNWGKNELDNEDTDLWQDDWGDEDLDKNFENQLRNEITKEAMNAQK